jgi:hypothetical protein
MEKNIIFNDLRLFPPVQVYFFRKFLQILFILYHYNFIQCKIIVFFFF